MDPAILAIRSAIGSHSSRTEIGAGVGTCRHGLGPDIVFVVAVNVCCWSLVVCFLFGCCLCWLLLCLWWLMLVGAVILLAILCFPILPPALLVLSHRRCGHFVFA